MPNLIENLKSIFKTKEGPITPLKAKDIQKKHKEERARRSSQKKECTPPYLAIVSQVFDPNQQVSKAAIFNLAEIAVQTTKYKKEILKLLEKSQNNKELSQEIVGYIQDRIGYINHS